MKPSNVAVALKSCVQARRPALVKGPPGVGKSQTIASVADELFAPSGFASSLNAVRTWLIDLRTCQMDPVDLRGLPYVNGDKRSHWATPEFLPRNGAGILFMDEFPQAIPAMMNACSELILDRRLGDYRLPDGWTIIAAGNNMTDRAATNRLPSHIANRFIHLSYEIDHDDWTRWALASGIRTEVIAFLRFRPELLHAFDPNSPAFPSPRSWEFVSQILDTNPDASVEFDLYAGAVGEAAAAEFTGFLRVYRTLPSVDGILLAPDTVHVPTDPATLYAICGALARKASDMTFDAIARYAGRMAPEFGVFLVSSSVKKSPSVQQTRAFIEWSSKNANVLI